MRRRTDSRLTDAEQRLDNHDGVIKAIQASLEKIADRLPALERKILILGALFVAGSSDPERVLHLLGL